MHVRRLGLFPDARPLSSRRSSLDGGNRVIRQPPAERDKKPSALLNLKVLISCPSSASFLLLILFFFLFSYLKIFFLHLLPIHVFPSLFVPNFFSLVLFPFCFPTFCVPLIPSFPPLFLPCALRAFSGLSQLWFLTPLSAEMDRNSQGEKVQAVLLTTSACLRMATKRQWCQNTKVMSTTVDRELLIFVTAQLSSLMVSGLQIGRSRPRHQSCTRSP